MDIETQGYSDPNDPTGGVRVYQRITAVVDGHTHIYLFPQAESPRAIRIVKLHVEEGQLHPYAGLMMVNMIRESERAF